MLPLVHKQCGGQGAVWNGNTCSKHTVEYFLLFLFCSRTEIKFFFILWGFFNSLNFVKASISFIVFRGRECGSVGRVQCAQDLIWPQRSIKLSMVCALVTQHLGSGRKSRSSWAIRDPISNKDRIPLMKKAGLIWKFYCFFLMISPNYDTLVSSLQQDQFLNPMWSPGWIKESHGSQSSAPRRKMSQKATAQETNKSILIHSYPREREVAGWNRITGVLMMRRWWVCTGATERLEHSLQFSVRLNFMKLSETVIGTAKCMGL